MVQRKYGVGFVLALYPLYVEVCVFQPFNPLKWDFFSWLIHVNTFQR